MEGEAWWEVRRYGWMEGGGTGGEQVCCCVVLEYVLYWSSMQPEWSGNFSSLSRVL